jgi:hypothetical protein
MKKKSKKCEKIYCVNGFYRIKGQKGKYATESDALRYLVFQNMILEKWLRGY